LKPIGIQAFNPNPMTGEGNWTWLIAGEVPTLIDAGVGDPRHVDAVERALAGADLAQVLVTHTHPDHASGTPAIAERQPRAEFRKMPAPGWDERWSVPWLPVRDGDALVAGDTTVVAVHTPGHSPDHLCFWHEATRTVFCGDLAQKGTTVWIPSSEGGDLAAYLASLERILALNPARLLPAHGPIIDDPASLLRGYIAHRQQREAQIVDALRHGDARVEAMVARIYLGLADALVPQARETVTSHLLKLEREGRVARDGDAWHIIGRSG
jgi:glyoxylase-like metal-dependent hydrolase (beta-lactamase superfamily II)